MKRNNYFYENNQGRNIILGITSTYIDLQAPDGYFYFEGKFDSKIQELARKVIPNEIGKLIQERKEIATGTLERIGFENFPFEKVILKADNKKEMLKIILIVLNCNFSMMKVNILTLFWIKVRAIFIQKK